MPNTVHAAQSSGIEQRLHSRKKLLFPWIKLGADNGGIVLDISESGLAMQTVRDLEEGELSLSFQLSESQAWIEARGRVAWLNASKNIAGVKFVCLSEEGCNRIRQWNPLPVLPLESASQSGFEGVEPIKEPQPQQKSATATKIPELDPARFLDDGCAPNAGEPTDVPRKSVSQQSPVVSQESRERAAKPVPAPDTGNVMTILSCQHTKSGRGSEDRTGRTTSHRLGRFLRVSAILALLLLSGNLVVDYRFDHSRNAANRTEVKAAPQVPLPLAPASPLVPPVTSSSHVDQTGTVLQVGAMTHEINADALAESLRKRGFPVFVTRRENDRFYRVLVGPFGDIDSILRVKEQLSEEAVQAFPIPWNASTP